MDCAESEGELMLQYEPQMSLLFVCYYIYF